MLLKKAQIETPLPLYYVGPDLEEGPLPCVIYLALSAKESLMTDPFNQPVLPLYHSSIRVFSVDLPHHGETLASTEGMKKWAHSFSNEEDILSHFLDQLETSLRLVFSKFPPSNIGIMGLSRGGFLASHLAARFSNLSSFVAFAPLTRLDLVKEFSALIDSPSIQKLHLSFLTETLCQKNIRIYIGNRDLRVSTDACYTWVKALVEAAFSKEIRSPTIELLLKPSIGFLGHGTSKESFQEGASWLLSKL